MAELDEMGTPLEDVKPSLPLRERELRRWLAGDGISIMLSVYIKHKRLEMKPSALECIRVLFEWIVAKEASEMQKDNLLQKHLSEYTTKTSDFSIDTLSS